MLEFLSCTVSKFGVCLTLTLTTMYMVGFSGYLLQKAVEVIGADMR